MRGRIARGTGEGVQERGEGAVKKKLRMTLCPNASFCCRSRRPADYLSRGGRACISVKSRSLHRERGALEKERPIRETERTGEAEGER